MDEMTQPLINALAPQPDGTKIAASLMLRMVYREKPNLVSNSMIAVDDIQEYLWNGIKDAQEQGQMVVFDQTPGQYPSHVLSLKPYREMFTDILATLMIFQKNGDIRYYYVLAEREETSG